MLTHVMGSRVSFTRFTSTFWVARLPGNSSFMWRHHCSSWARNHVISIHLFWLYYRIHRRLVHNLVPPIQPVLLCHLGHLWRAHTVHGGVMVRLQEALPPVTFFTLRWRSLVTTLTVMSPFRHAPLFTRRTSPPVHLPLAHDLLQIFGQVVKPLLQVRTSPGVPPVLLLGQELLWIFSLTNFFPIFVLLLAASAVVIMAATGVTFSAVQEANMDDTTSGGLITSLPHVGTTYLTGQHQRHHHTQAEPCDQQNIPTTTATFVRHDAPRPCALSPFFCVTVDDDGWLWPDIQVWQIYRYYAQACGWTPRAPLTQFPIV